MDLKRYRSGIIFTSLLDCPFDSIKNDRFGIMTAIYCKLNQEIMTTVTPLLDVVSLLKQIYISHGVGMQLLISIPPNRKYVK